MARDYATEAAKEELRKAVKKGFKPACNIAQFAFFAWVVTHMPGFRDTWLKTLPESATVLTVQVDGFWGPAQVLIPTNCTRFAESDALHEDEGVAWAEDVGEGGSGDDEQGNTTEGRLDQEQVDDADGVSSNGTHTIVTRCGKTLAFLEPSWFQRWGAMLWLLGHDTMSELRIARCQMMVFFIFMGVLENLFQMFLTGCVVMEMEEAEKADSLPKFVPKDMAMMIRLPLYVKKGLATITSPSKRCALARRSRS